LHGNRGCGTSVSLLWKSVQTAYLDAGCRVAIYRKTWPEVRRNIWDELLKLPQDLFDPVNSSNHRQPRRVFRLQRAVYHQFF
jgi:hypothetical protein